MSLPPSLPPSPVALCISVCFSLTTGAARSHNELMPNPNLHCALAKGASMNSMGQ